MTDEPLPTGFDLEITDIDDDFKYRALVNGGDYPLDPIGVRSAIVKAHKESLIRRAVSKHYKDYHDAFDSSFVRLIVGESE